MSTDCRLYRRSLAIGYYESGSTKEASMISRVASLSECEIENVLEGPCVDGTFAARLELGLVWPVRIQ